jgi:peptidyl-prolyl cis-trans isomerase D
MSIIQSIRDKGAAIVIGVIALSLIGFLLMDARSGASRGLFGGNSRVVGSVNGEDIDVDEFNTKVKTAEDQYQNSMPRPQIMQTVWDQIVGEKILTDQFDKLGLTFTAQEMSATILSENAPPALKQAFSDPETGQYDIEKARQWLRDMKKSKNEEQRAAINSQVIEPMRLNSLYTKYTSMIGGSVYIPTWMAAKENEEAKAFANISYVAIPYSDISDSTIKVTDNDIENYIEKNKVRYKQEAGRMISYVSFSAVPNVKDSILAKSSLLALKNSFAADTNTKAFISRNLSEINYSDSYVSKANLQGPAKDSIIALPDGGVFGPYLDGANYVLAKKVSTKILPDSIKCRHILIGTTDPQSGQQLMVDSTAKQKIDSIENAIKGGASFDSLEAEYSTDKVAHKDKGVMTFDLASIQSENFAKEFGDFLLNENGETKKVVHTQFGWHYIEILEKKNPGPAYKVAYLAKNIAPSEETIRAADAASTKLSGMARDLKSFEKYVKENGLTKIDVPTVIKENDYQVGSLQDARQIVKWAFDAKEGEVSEPFSLKDEYVVAVVDKKISEGLPDAKTARPLVETIVRNKKKADEIKKKLGNPTSLENAAAVYKKQVLTTGSDSTLTFNAFIISGVGSEPRVAGASFNKQYQQKVSPPIEGNTGIFLIKVNSVNQRPADPPQVAEQKRAARIMELIQGGQGQQMRPSVGAINGSYNSLKKMAEIKDKRSKFF